MRKVLTAGGCVSSSKSAPANSGNSSMAAAAKPSGGEDEEEWATVSGLAYTYMPHVGFVVWMQLVHLTCRSVPLWLGAAGDSISPASNGTAASWVAPHGWAASLYHTILWGNGVSMAWKSDFAV